MVSSLLGPVEIIITGTLNDGPDSRIVGVGAQILKDLGVKKIRLLGASAKYPLTGFDLEITEFIN